MQPSAIEVLGFGQTANASPSGLPFRFYEQSRRAPNDPTARSVFASVDKVPGDALFIPQHDFVSVPVYSHRTSHVHELSIENRIEK